MKEPFEQLSPKIERQSGTETDQDHLNNGENHRYLEWNLSEIIMGKGKHHHCLNHHCQCRCTASRSVYAYGESAGEYSLSHIKEQRTLSGIHRSADVTAEVFAVAATAPQ